MGDHAEAILAALERRGWVSEQARRRLEESGWMALLPAVMDQLGAEAIAEDLVRHTRCVICGHPLHQMVGDVGLTVEGAQRIVRNLPHTAACSCGYARPLIPEVWVAAAGAYFRRHPAAREADAGDIAGR